MRVVGDLGCGSWKFEGPGHFAAYRSKAASRSDGLPSLIVTLPAQGRNGAAGHRCRRKPSFHAVKITALGPVTQAARSQPVRVGQQRGGRPGTPPSSGPQSMGTADPCEYRRTAVADVSKALTTSARASHPQGRDARRTPVPNATWGARPASSAPEVPAQGFDRPALESVMITSFPLGSPESCSPNAFAAEPRYSPSNDATTLPGQRCIVGQGQGSSPVASGEALDDLLHVFGPPLR